MNQLLEWLPLIVFLAVFKIAGIYWATAALMVGCIALMFIHRWRTGKYKTMHVAAAGVVIVLGTATLLFHDKRFIQWKPTVLLCAAAVAFLGSTVFGKQPLARRMLEGVFQEPVYVSNRTWLGINLLWVGWFAALAAANLYIAWNYSESTWVYFKVAGISVATLIFMMPQVMWLNSRTKP